MQRRFDVLVVGAGPAGSVAAREAARLGCGTVLLVDRKDFPRQKVCAGGLTPKTCGLLRELGLWEKASQAAHAICGLRVVSPSGREMTLLEGEPGAILNRSRLDQMLVDAAVEAGAEFRPAVAALDLLYRGGRVVGARTSDGEVSARWVVVAAGGGSRFRWDRRAPHIVRTRIAWFEGARFTPHVAELVYDRELLPYYGWLFPESATRVNVGISVDGARRERPALAEVFKRFLNRHFAERLAGSTQVGRPRGHPICGASRVAHRAPEGVLLAGEANGLTSLATGEGIFYATKSGALAAAAIHGHCTGRLNAAQTARFYEASLQTAFRARFASNHLFHRAGVAFMSLASRCAGPLCRRAAVTVLSWL
jgi:geranylgeranyl reductase family protein